MIRCRVPSVAMTLAFAIILSASAAAQTPAGPPPVPQPKPATAPTCTYSSKAYSDGAFVCVQKSLMLKCTVDDTKAAWSVVADKDLSDKCLAPAARGTVYQQRSRWHRRNIAREITPPS